MSLGCEFSQHLCVCMCMFSFSTSMALSSISYLSIKPELNMSYSIKVAFLNKPL